MAPSNLPPIFNATSQDVEMLLAAQCHIGSKNLQVHMEPYLWKTRPDGINVINIGKTWYDIPSLCNTHSFTNDNTGRRLSSQPACS
jgi:small subunit ribosomal protein SAe